MDTRTEKRRTGDLGEDLACKYLLSKGFVVTERNYWRPYGEIDIIAEKGGKLFFFEVKTVTRGTKATISHETELRVGESGSRVTPRNVPRERSIREGEYRAEDNIHPWKIKRLQKALQSYLVRYTEEVPWQLDGITVVLDKVAKTAKIKRIEHIVL